MARTEYRHRVIILKWPEGSPHGVPDRGWRPDGHPEDSKFIDDEGYFHWPRQKTYNTSNGAERRAELFRRYGATCKVIRSQPIRWDEAEDLVQDTKRKERAIATALKILEDTA